MRSVCAFSSKRWLCENVNFEHSFWLFTKIEQFPSKNEHGQLFTQFHDGFEQYSWVANIHEMRFWTVLQSRPSWKVQFWTIFSRIAHFCHERKGIPFYLHHCDPYKCDLYALFPQNDDSAKMLILNIMCDYLQKYNGFHQKMSMLSHLLNFGTTLNSIHG